MKCDSGLQFKNFFSCYNFFSKFQLNTVFLFIQPKLTELLRGSPKIGARDSKTRQSSREDQQRRRQL